MDAKDLAYRVLPLVPTILSLTVHEWAHAFSAKLLGDTTAEREGRLTLNPIPHIDLVGTLLLPLMGVPFGWAKPVPVNPARFTRRVSMRTGMAIVAAAGPFSNFVLAVVSAVALGLFWRFEPTNAHLSRGVSSLLAFSVTLNLSLGLFNLLPVPPLDGSRIAYRFLAGRYPRAWERFERLAPFALIGVFLGARYILAAPMAALDGVIEQVARSIAGA